MIEVCSFFITGEKRLHINFIEEFQIEQCSSNRALCMRATNKYDSNFQALHPFVFLYLHHSVYKFSQSSIPIQNTVQESNMRKEAINTASFLTHSRTILRCHDSISSLVHVLEGGLGLLVHPVGHSLDFFFAEDSLPGRHRALPVADLVLDGFLVPSTVKVLLHSGLGKSVALNDVVSAALVASSAVSFEDRSRVDSLSHPRADKSASAGDAGHGGATGHHRRGGKLLAGERHARDADE